MIFSPANFINLLWRRLTLVIKSVSWLGWLGWLGLACLGSTALAEPARWAELAHTPFQSVNTGLPHPVVAALAEDGDGFLWIGTQAGLARWDGYHFRLAKDLPDQWIQTLHTDQRGQLWIGTRSAGLIRYQRELDQFIPVSSQLSHLAVRAIANAGSNQDAIWLGTDGGLDLLTVSTQKIEHWHHTNKTANRLPSQRIGTLLLDHDNQLWIGTDRGLVRRTGQPGAATLQTIALPLPTDQMADITSLFQAQDRRIWIGTRKHGAFLYDTGKQQILALQKNIALSIDTIYSITQAGNDEVWLGSFGQGIIAVNTKTLEARRIVRQAGIASSLNDNTIWSMLRDRAGLVWVGTNHGLARHNSTQQAIHSLIGHPENSDGLSFDAITSILSANDGRIWLGLDKNGVNIIDQRAQHVMQIPPDPGLPDTALPKAAINIMQSSGSDTVLLGSMRGLYQITPVSGSQPRPDTPGQGHEFMIKRIQIGQRSQNAIISGLLVQDTSLWIGYWDGLWQQSAAALLPKARSKILPSDIFEQIGAKFNLPNSLSDQRISTIEAASGGALWIGTGNGLNWYDPATKRLLTMRATSNDTGALTSGRITSLLTDKAGRLWVGTLGGGLHLLETPAGQFPARFRRFGTDDGLPSANIQKLVMDNSGQIWASSDDHILRIDPQQLTLHRMQAADGIVLGAYMPGAGTRTAQGEILFGSRHGLTVIRPNAFQEWNYRAPIAITDIRIQGKMIAAAHFNTIQKSNLEIQPEANQFTVEFAALDFSAPELNRYQYRLDGYDRHWIATDIEHRQATYTNLPPGQYQLRLRGSNRNGLWNENVLSITVWPAWYQTWWFRLGLSLALALLLITLLQARTAYLRKSKRELEAKVAQRTLQLEQSNQNLHQANADLALSAETLRELGDIGRDITANLDVSAAFETLYRHVNKLLNAPALTIYRLSKEGDALVLHFGREHQTDLPKTRIALDQPHSNAAKAARERREILLALRVNDDNPYHIPGTHPMLTSLFAPLIIDEKLLGVISIHSHQEQAFGERECLIFRTLSAYTAIAFDNANAYLQLQKAQERLVAQEKLAALGSLVAGVAHELNTPLGNSMMMTSSLQDGLRTVQNRLAQHQLTSADLRNYFQDTQQASDIIMRGLGSAAKLVTSFKQVAVDRTSEQRRQFDLRQTCLELIAAMGGPAHNGGIQIHVNIPDAIILDSYPGPLGQVIEHLVQNALLHGFEGRNGGQIILSAHQEIPNWIRIECQDDGTGIPLELQKRVFEPFFTSKMGQGSIGLGLSICYNIVQSLLGGQISLISNGELGTRFIVDIPLSPPKESLP